MFTYRPSGVFICSEVCTPEVLNGVWLLLPRILSRKCAATSESFVQLYSYSWVS